MDERDWQEIRELRLQNMGTNKGIALGNLIAEKQRLDKIRQIANGVKIDKTITKALALDKIIGILKEE
jgi:hypothetical protein